jgi:hypothetical protein
MIHVRPVASVSRVISTRAVARDRVRHLVRHPVSRPLLVSRQSPDETAAAAAIAIDDRWSTTNKCDHLTVNIKMHTDTKPNSTLPPIINAVLGSLGLLQGFTAHAIGQVRCR